MVDFGVKIRIINYNYLNLEEKRFIEDIIV